MKVGSAVGANVGVSIVEVTWTNVTPSTSEVDGGAMWTHAWLRLVTKSVGTKAQLARMLLVM